MLHKKQYPTNTENGVICASCTYCAIFWIEEWSANNVLNEIINFSKMSTTGVCLLPVVSADFDLIFSRASTMDFVLMRNIPRLEAISVCLWMRTSDVSHYGTIMSYAADSNWLSADDSNVFVLHDYGSLEVSGSVLHSRITLSLSQHHSFGIHSVKNSTKCDTLNIIKYRYSAF